MMTSDLVSAVPFNVLTVFCVSRHLSTRALPGSQNADGSIVSKGAPVTLCPCSAMFAAGLTWHSFGFHRTRPAGVVAFWTSPDIALCRTINIVTNVAILSFGVVLHRRTLFVKAATVSTVTVC